MSLSYGILIRRALSFYADHLQAFLNAVQGEPEEAAPAQRYAEFMKVEAEALLASAGERRGKAEADQQQTQACGGGGSEKEEVTA
jgi:hypothetical protein